MKKLVLGLTLVTALSVATAPAFATGNYQQKKVKFLEKVCMMIPGVCAKIKEKHMGQTQPTNVQSVPEIDAANAGLALALIGGLVAIRRERKKA